MLMLLAVVVTTGIGPLQAPDTAALAAALGYARTEIPEGPVLVSSDTVPQTEVRHTAGRQLPAPHLLERAASMAGFSFGRDREAVICDGPYRKCRGRGTFRGLVRVVEYRSPDPNSLTVKLQVLGFTPDHLVDELVGPVDEWVAEVQVARSSPTSDWHIERIIGIRES